MTTATPLRLWRSLHLEPFIPLISRLITLASVVVLVGLLPWLSGRDPALSILRARSAEQEATPEALAAIRAQLGLDLGPFEKLQSWLMGLLHGDAGNSWISGAPVLPGMLKSAQVSLTLMGFGMLVAMVTATLICVPVVRRGLKGQVRRSSGAIGAALTALPEFLLASILLVVFAAWLNWLPPYGWRGFSYVVLPAFALGLPAGGLLGRLFSDGLSATFTERWVATWNVAGFSHRRITLAALRRTLPSLMPQVGMVMVGLTGGAIAVEQVFSIPGLGRATLGAASAQDMPALQTGILILLIIAIVLGSLANIGRALLLGRAFRLGALPVAQHQQNVQRWVWVVPAIAIVLLMVLVAAGIGRDPFSSAFMRLQPPSLALPLGADGTGRDILARVAHGALSTMGMAILVVFFSLVLGLLIGLAPRLATGPIEITKATPPAIAGLIVAGLMGPSASGAIIAVTAVAWAPLAAHTAALVAETKAQPHVRITPILGVGHFRLMSRYILPAVLGPVFRHAMLRLPGVALALAALGFLGLGPRPPSPEWGLILAEGMPYIERAPWAVLIPALALILLSVLAVSLSSIAGSRRPPR
ncbi:ABC transporter permease subunit [Vreelandella boliviensis]|uniref:ABC transporter permease n=1 Tax=Vreelandella boliviensis LC1 TaxID=1072583 RepID=A0A265E2E5_9GAMM|nr:ABC transporter permease subunit [Halomonas boliviensis]EHJ93727.1 Nickel transport system permease protein nikB [Halomonas boliviensis LC1]OZT75773.1 ABC transporter permease [Halomonas boliviensis LC1]